MQFSFKKEHSTTQQVLRVIERIYNQIELMNLTAAAFLNVRKNFNSALDVMCR